MKKLFMIYVCLFLTGCIFSDIKYVPCNEFGRDVCEKIGDRIFVASCKSSAVGSEKVYNRCLSDIAKRVNDMGFDYFVILTEVGDTYSDNYAMTTNKPITTYHNYNANTSSNFNVYGTGRLSGYSAYGTGTSNTHLTGNSTTYVPVLENYTITTNTYKALFMPIESNEIAQFNRYYRVADYM